MSRDSCNCNWLGDTEFVMLMIVLGTPLILALLGGVRWLFRFTQNLLMG